MMKLMMTGGKIRKSDKNDENSVILQNFYSIPFNNLKKSPPLQLALFSIQPTKNIRSTISIMLYSLKKIHSAHCDSTVILRKRNDNKLFYHFNKKYSINDFHHA